MDSRPKRVLVAGLYHETHTFVPGRTRLADFTALHGDELWSAVGQESPLAGVLEAARSFGWAVVPAVDMRAMPSGIVQDEVVETWWAAFETAARASLRDGPLDGIFLVLHGAMVSESLCDVEGEILGRLRAIPALNALPLAGVTDLHANVSARMARCGDALVTYRRNPHTDARDAATGAAALLAQIMASGRRPTTVWVPIPIVLPPTATATADDPMRALQTLAREIEAADPQILAVNVHAGFAFADTPDTGMSVTAITVGDPEDARRELERLAAAAVGMRAAARPRDIPLDDAFAALAEVPEGLVLLVEPSDNIGAGAPGDGVALLRALVERRIGPAAVVVTDPQAVALLADAAPGERRTLDIGGKSSGLYGGPCRLAVELVRRTDGRFRLEDPNSHLASMAGSDIAMGPCAVVRHDRVWILLTSRPTAPFDLGQLRSQGIEPEGMRVIGVKAAVAHRRAYDPIARASFSVLTPGPCASDLKSLPYRNVRRPAAPLDDL